MNSILVIHPYFSGTWVFDDPTVGLVREPFVSGIPEMIDRLLLEKGLTNAKKGFNLYFSASPFPGYDVKANWLKQEFGGNWYRVDWPSDSMDGWLCPALFKYFEKAPKNLYIKVDNSNAVRL